MGKSKRGYWDDLYSFEGDHSQEPTLELLEVKEDETVNVHMEEAHEALSRFQNKMVRRGERPAGLRKSRGWQ